MFLQGAGISRIRIRFLDSQAPGSHLPAGAWAQGRHPHQRHWLSHSWAHNATMTLVSLDNSDIPVPKTTLCSQSLWPWGINLIPGEEWSQAEVQALQTSCASGTSQGLLQLVVLHGCRVLGWTLVSVRAGELVAFSCGFPCPTHHASGSR